MYVSLFGISGALHLDIFEQPAKQVFFSNLLELSVIYPKRARRQATVPKPKRMTPAILLASRSWLGVS